MLTPIPELIRSISPNVRTLSAEQALAEAAEHPNSLVIDVREPGEVAERPIKGSINIPRGVLEMKLSTQYNDPQLPIYLHCATGARATLSAEQLQRIGYRNVTVIGCPIDTLEGVCNRENCA
ncbi:rhodanese-like domain-containing protein [Motiliproteus sp. SC1-56]|uniref:rhodanese-like domain-containing protein n=1 Tax=Motiliproteus sp. SC1-56 TaxID=2799565 RepID=UPI001A8E0647|nr:rhodanese-like domain-containing protein [Motiliproteus sp. SC1-56]